MVTKAIRGVTDEEWGELKSRASTQGLSMGRYIMKLSQNSLLKTETTNWEKILAWKARDSREIKDMKKRIKEFREEFELRKPS